MRSRIQLLLLLLVWLIGCSSPAGKSKDVAPDDSRSGDQSPHLDGGETIGGQDLRLSDSEEPGITIGPEGGVVEGPGGVSVEFQPGSLRESAKFSIDLAEDVDPGVQAFSPVYHFSPATVAFVDEPTVQIPTTSAPAAADEADIGILWSDSPEGPWGPIPSQYDAATGIASGYPSHFSYGVVANLAKGKGASHAWKMTYDHGDGIAYQDALFLPDGTLMFTGLTEPCYGEIQNKKRAIVGLEQTGTILWETLVDLGRCEESARLLPGPEDTTILFAPMLNVVRTVDYAGAVTQEFKFGNLDLPFNPANGHIYAHDLAIDTDGFLYGAGLGRDDDKTRYGLILTKLTATGEQVWDTVVTEFPDGCWLDGARLFRGPDGRLYFAGLMEVDGVKTMQFVSTDSNGMAPYEASYVLPGPDEAAIEAKAHVFDKAGSRLIVVATELDHQASPRTGSVHVVAFGADSEPQWTRKFPVKDSPEGAEVLSAGAAVHDDGSIVISWVERSGEWSWATQHLVSLNGNGDILHHKEYELAKLCFRPYLSIAVDSGRNAYCTLAACSNAGVESYDTTKFDSSGDFIWSINTPPIGEIRHTEPMENLFANGAVFLVASIYEDGWFGGYSSDHKIFAVRYDQ